MARGPPQEPETPLKGQGRPFGFRCPGGAGSTGGPRLRIPGHDRRAGRGWQGPGGGRPGTGWRAPRPPHARAGRAARILSTGLGSAPAPAPARAAARAAGGARVTYSTPPRCRLGVVVSGCAAPSAAPRLPDPTARLPASGHSGDPEGPKRPSWGDEPGSGPVGWAPGGEKGTKHSSQTQRGPRPEVVIQVFLLRSDNILISTMPGLPLQLGSRKGEETMSPAAPGWIWGQETWVETIRANHQPSGLGQNLGPSLWRDPSDNGGLRVEILPRRYFM
ncbi:PREDICTED: proline-rich protein HaeIII subfamily 1-like [Condylura cristata]|uniref:proline-rich protein HaeIII subfamily 1-like n=1 Tax=Condylura cristata TaxID=143302 RepID=UPI0006429AE7|nr:PREDICTED: proline-rich protein HaeIII subfamily 1-like [Condylura cristata]